MKRKLFNNKGFTLMEMIVVLVVLAILMCIAAPSVFGYSRKAQETAAIAEAKEVVTAMIGLMSEHYKETGFRITGDECLIKDGGSKYGDDYDMVMEARKLAGIVSKNKDKSDDPKEWHGRVRGAWIRGSQDYILSHLVYEYSKDIWVVYDNGEYLVYKGETNTPEIHRKEGEKPDTTKQKEPPRYDKPGGATKETLTFPEVVPKETTTETTTESTEATTETTTESKKDDGFFSFAAGRWNELKYYAYTEDGKNWKETKEYDLHNFKAGWLYSDKSGTYLCIGDQNVKYTPTPIEDTLEDYINKNNYQSSFVRIDPNLNIYTEEDYRHDMNIIESINNMEYFKDCCFANYKQVYFNVVYPDNSSINVYYDATKGEFASPQTLPTFDKPFDKTETFKPPVDIKYETEIHTWWNPITGNDVIVKYNYKTKEKTFVNSVVANGKSYTFDELCNESQQFRDAVNNEIANFENQIKAQEKQNEDALQQFNAKKEAEEAEYYATQEKCKAVNVKIQEACQMLSGPNGVNIIIRGDIIYYNGKFYIYGSYNETGRSDLRLLGHVWQDEWPARDDGYNPEHPAVHGNFCELTDLEGKSIDEVLNGIRSLKS